MEWRDNGENFKFHFSPVCGDRERQWKAGAVTRDTTRETYFPLVSLAIPPPPE